MQTNDGSSRYIKECKCDKEGGSICSQLLIARGGLKSERGKDSHEVVNKQNTRAGQRELPSLLTKWGIARLSVKCNATSLGNRYYVVYRIP